MSSFRQSSRRSKAEIAVKDPLMVPDMTAIVVSEVDDDDCANDADEDTADDTVRVHELLIDCGTIVHEIVMSCMCPFIKAQLPVLEKICRSRLIVSSCFSFYFIASEICVYKVLL